MRMTILLNKDGGTIRGMEPSEFGDHIAATLAGDAAGSGRCQVRLVHGPELINALAELEADDDLEGIVAGGGDGTVSAAAAACFRSGKTLGVLPLGTMNLYARSLGLPRDPYEAAKVLATATTGNLDIATVNGRPFIHQVSIGLHEQLVSLRSRLDTSTRFRKITSTLKVLGDVIMDPPRFPVETLIDGHTRQALVSAVSVSNNLFGNSPVPFAPLLDEGVLGVYHAKAFSSPRVLRMTLDAARGALMANPYVDVETTERVTLRFPKKRRRAHAAIDGEIVDLEPELECICHAGGLRVLVPSKADTENSG